MNKKDIKFLFYSITHPINSFYDIRHHGKGNLKLSLLIVFLCGVAYSVNRRYASFIVNSADPMDVNSILNILSVFALFFLFCLGNWSVTCLMNGEGRMQDIITATGYALLPIILIFIPATLISQFIAADEQTLYYLLIDIAVIWGVLLVICSNMVIQNYTLAMELKALMLTLVAMVIILFIILLFYTMFQQLVEFIMSIYIELIFRI